MARTRIVSDTAEDTEDAGAERAPSPDDEGPREDRERPTPGATEVVDAAAHYAGHLRETTASMFHFTAMAPALKGVDMPTYKIYRDRLLADCGAPTDPIEVMIIEQLSMARFSVGLLSCRTTSANRPESVKIYSGAAARLMGEFRRSALALQAYRAASRQLARDPTKHIVIPAEAADPDDTEETHQTTEMGLIPEESDEWRPVIPLPRAASL